MFPPRYENLKQLRHPGPVDAVRIESFDGRSETLDISLAAGLNLLDAVSAPLHQAGLASAGVTFRNVRFGPFRYVVPAFSPDAKHVAYYSATHAPVGDVEVAYANLTYGQKDGHPFLHCHALWRDGVGRSRGGHVLPLDTFVESPGQAVAVGSRDVKMLSQFDPETNFTLFHPIPLGAPQMSGESRCIVARIKPNVDLIEGIEEICHRHGVSQAVVRSGVGSIVGAEFEGGRVIDEHPTEILVLAGRVAPDEQGRPRADLSIAVIDTSGDIHEGRPARGRNPVLICFEAVLEEAARPIERR